jgi:hypothetical protein
VATLVLDGVTIDVPEGWKAVEVPTFSTCTAKPRTTYLAPKFDFSYGQPSEGPEAGNAVVDCGAMWRGRWTLFTGPGFS